MKRILFTGPESTGKSALATRLAEEWDTVWVPEYARTYLEQLGRSYNEADLLNIAKGQLQWEDQYAEKATDFLFIDTGMLVMTYGCSAALTSHGSLAPCGKTPTSGKPCTASTGMNCNN
jgi:nicotinamide riboside kinase